MYSNTNPNYKMSISLKRAHLALLEEIIYLFMTCLVFEILNDKVDVSFCLIAWNPDFVAQNLYTCI